jgi:hypothetical protein
MSYYTVIDLCPTCYNLQQRWIVTHLDTIEDTILCNKCINYYPIDSSMFKIVLQEDKFINIKEVNA